MYGIWNPVYIKRIKLNCLISTEHASYNWQQASLAAILLCMSCFVCIQQKVHCFLLAEQHWTNCLLLWMAFVKRTHDRDARKLLNITWTWLQQSKGMINVTCFQEDNFTEKKKERVCISPRLITPLTGGQCDWWEKTNQGRGRSCNIHCSGYTSLFLRFIDQFTYVAMTKGG